MASLGPNVLGGPYLKEEPRSHVEVAITASPHHRGPAISAPGSDVLGGAHSKKPLNYFEATSVRMSSAAPILKTKFTSFTIDKPLT